MYWKYVFVLLFGFTSAHLFAQDVEYTIFEDTDQESGEQDSADEDSASWVPLTQEMFDGQIHQVFPVDEKVWTWSIAVSQRFDALCDIRPHAPIEPEVYCFGGLAFNR